MHDLCFQARDGLNGNLDYGFLARIMDLMAIEAEEQLDIIRKINRTEKWLKESSKAKQKPGITSD
ncbi:MAG: hypothetical protein AB1611_03175 [bacterium]